jgi:hypothetical protein
MLRMVLSGLFIGGSIFVGSFIGLGSTNILSNDPDLTAGNAVRNALVGAMVGGGAALLVQGLFARLKKASSEQNSPNT